MGRAFAFERFRIADIASGTSGHIGPFEGITEVREKATLRLLNHPVHMRQQRLVGRNTKRYRCLEPMKVSAARLCRKKASGIKSAVLDS